MTIMHALTAAVMSRSARGLRGTITPVTIPVPTNAGGANLPSISPTGSATAGSVTYTATTGTWTGSPSSYTYQWYIGGVAQGSPSGTNTFTPSSGGPYGAVTVGVIATNAGGNSAEAVSTTSVTATAPAGVAPDWTGAPQPGWVYQDSYAVGVVMTADFGEAANNPDVNGYSYQVLRSNGNSTTVVASGSNVSGFTYTPVAGDQYQQLSFSLTASNASGSATTTAASVTIN